jgi:hypothetical protein
LIVALIRATLFRRQILMMLLTGPVIGAASGIVLGLFAFIHPLAFTSVSPIFDQRRSRDPPADVPARLQENLGTTPGEGSLRLFAVSTGSSRSSFRTGRRRRTDGADDRLAKNTGCVERLWPQSAGCVERLQLHPVGAAKANEVDAGARAAPVAILGA